MTQEQLEALLGRPLTSTEIANLTLYINIATLSLEEMICTSVAQVTEERTYDSRNGYKTVFTDLFTAVTVVKIDDVTQEASTYSKRQWDNRNGTWFNSIVFDDKVYCKEVKVTATYGWPTLADMPVDLQQLFAGLFGLVSKKNNTNSLVKSKQVEDFRITFKDDTTVTDQFALDNASVIDKYSLCNIPDMESGYICKKRCYGYYRV